MKHENTPLAQKLRKDQTKEEAKLWYQFLRKYPLQFRRQVPIDKYIVDFYCAKAQLVVELDGSQHYEEEGVEKDQARTAVLEQAGLQVLRFSNADVSYRFREVCTAIDIAVKEKNERIPSSAPLGGTFPPRGR